MSKSSSEWPKALTWILLGLVLGVVGTLVGQKAFRYPAAEADRAEEGIATMESKASKADRRRHEALRPSRTLGRPGEAPAKTPQERPESEPDSSAADGEAPKPNVLEVLMEMGAAETERSVEDQVAKWAQRMNLSDFQQAQVKAVLLARKKEEQEAGMRMLSGKATLEDLVAADKDNYTAVDAAMASILSESQRQEYAIYQQEREVARIERKSEEDLKGLQGVADLTEEQADQAWQVFAEINAKEQPGQLPEGATIRNFDSFLDGAIGNRIGGLEPILTPEQLEAYRGQTEKFRSFVRALVNAGTGRVEGEKTR